MKMQLGAEPKKVMILGGLLVVAVFVFYTNVIDGGSGEVSSVQPPRATGNAAGVVRPTTTPVTTTRKTAARRSTEFRPTLKRSPQERADPASTDPALKLDLLQKLQTVRFNGSGRNLFEFGSAPPTPQEIAASRTPVPKIIPQAPPSSQASAPPPVTPAKPKAPPIPLKFYGYISTPKGTARRGFFLDGENIVVASEGETIKSRYKVVRIGLNNVEMEDTQFSQRQTLRLEVPPGGVG